MQTSRQVLCCDGAAENAAALRVAGPTTHVFRAASSGALPLRGCGLVVSVYTAPCGLVHRDSLGVCYSKLHVRGSRAPSSNRLATHLIPHCNSFECTSSSSSSSWARPGDRRYVQDVCAGQRALSAHHPRTLTHSDELPPTIKCVCRRTGAFVEGHMSL